MRFHTALSYDYAPPSSCDFGIISAPLAGILAGGLEGIVGAEAAGILGGVGAGALTGAGGGAALSGITGGDPLSGALGGALTGGAVGGIGAAGLGTAAEVAGGAAAGAAGAGITGGNPLLGAATGAGTGLVAGLSPSTTAGSGTSQVTGAPATGGGTSAVSTAPAAIAPSGGAPVDLTSAGALDAFYGSAGDAGSAPFGSAPAFGGTPYGVSEGLGGAAPPATATAPASTGGVGDLASKALGFVEKNPGAVLGAGALGLNLLMNQGTPTGEKGVQQAAGEAATAGRALSAYQISGTLPPGLQAVVDLQSKGAEASVRSAFANAGLSGSTMEAEKIAQVKQQKAAEIAGIADNLAKQGIQWSQLSAQEFNALLTAQTQQDTAFSEAIGRFAAGLAGGFAKSGTSTGTT